MAELSMEARMAIQEAKTAHLPFFAPAKHIEVIPDENGMIPNPNGDGTMQYVGVGGVHIVDLTKPMPETAPLDADHQKGATFRRKGVASDVPMTVHRTGDGIVFALFNDPERGWVEMAFYPNQIDLVTPAGQ